MGYTDGKVHPESNITRAEVATIFFRMLTDEAREQNWSNNNHFSDVGYGTWYNNIISTMTKKSILKGYPDGSFRPDANITRAELAAIITRFVEDTNYEGSNLFTDISGHWAANEINVAANIGWIERYPDGSFRPDAKITRAEVVTMVNRVMERIPENANDLLADMKIWPDNADTSQWYYIAIQEATNSHSHEKKNGGIYEVWIALQKNPDWAAIEKR